MKTLAIENNAWYTQGTSFNGLDGWIAAFRTEKDAEKFTAKLPEGAEVVSNGPHPYIRGVVVEVAFH